MTQSEALDILKLGRNVFLTGAAGAGKTHALNTYIALLKERGIAVGITASTGIAATHLEGMTIHSWSGIGIRDHVTQGDIKDFLKKSYLKKRFTETDVLIIDEASMLRPNQLDMVDQIARAFKEPFTPFGGMQIVLSGDMFQLPPISRDEPVPRLDVSPAYKEADFAVCYLHEQYRHDDHTLSAILDDIRSGNTGEHTREPLRARYKAEFAQGTKPTRLYTHNADVDRVNQEELSAIEGNPKQFVASTRGSGPLLASLIKSCLAPQILELKVGATVMFVKNNPLLGYVNGTLGTITGFETVAPNLPIVKTFDGKTITASPETWAIEEEGKIKAQLDQVPLRLAWAITVHKSQGMTLDAAEMDLSKSFVPGMGYVALSRVRKLEGLRLMGLNDTALQVDENVRSFDHQLQAQSAQANGDLAELSKKAKEEQQDSFLGGLSRVTLAEEKIPTIELTKDLVDEKKSISEMAKTRDLTEGTIIGHLEKLRQLNADIDIDYLKPPDARIIKVTRALEKNPDKKIGPLKKELGKDFSYDDVRIARLFV